MILFAPHRGQFATSSDMLLWVDVDFQVEMYLTKYGQFYMGDQIPFIEVQHWVGFHGLKGSIDWR